MRFVPRAGGFDRLSLSGMEGLPRFQKSEKLPLVPLRLSLSKPPAHIAAP
ncbi:hypothetical protein V474_24360 [Novosphingobium barchaimii LL02]|uniref:Uncharacterized protein n=1 Tax=Novosphingobium barchaimii LL02 TaxID=1114963 RepID=A0A0J7XPE3_9SPHN|nr:hypothetical protein V474_24360 [Novosphingobium barchaimii LL02]